jgi:hypothetical protein
METTQRYMVISFPDSNFEDGGTHFFEAANDQAAIEMVTAKDEDGCSEHLHYGDFECHVQITNITTEEVIYQETLNVGDGDEDEDNW